MTEGARTGDIRYYEWELCCFIGSESRHYLYCSIFSTRLLNLNTETVHHFNIFVLFIPCFQALCQALRIHWFHLGQDVPWPESSFPMIGILPQSYKAASCEAFKGLLGIQVLSLFDDKIYFLKEQCSWNSPVLPRIKIKMLFHRLSLKHSCLGCVTAFDIWGTFGFFCSIQIKYLLPCVVCEMGFSLYFVISVMGALCSR